MIGRRRHPAAIDQHAHVGAGKLERRDDVVAGALGGGIDAVVDQDLLRGLEFTGHLDMR